MRLRSCSLSSLFITVLMLPPTISAGYSYRLSAHGNDSPSLPQLPVSSLEKRQNGTTTVRVNFCRMWYHASAIINDKLYINGGHRTYREDYKDGVLTAFRTIMTVDLKLGLTFPLMNNQREVQEISGPTGLETTVLPNLWHDKGEALYKYGGEFLNGTYYNDPSGRLEIKETEAWKFDLTASRWTKLPIRISTQGSPILHRATGSGYTSVPGSSSDKGYAIGGLIGRETDTAFANVTGWMMLENLIEFDFSSQTFTNYTTPASVGPVRLASLVHLPGRNNNSEGFLIMLGGTTGSRETWYPSIEDYAKGTYHRPMNEIDIYDLNTKKWYKQKTTGDSPVGLQATCAIIVPATDKSSYQIYFYGGVTWNGPVNGDIWVLSIPSFQWIKVDTQGERRFGHTCHLAKGNIMVTVGGRDRLQDDEKLPNGKWAIGPKEWSCLRDGVVSAFDLNTFEWKSEVRKENREYLIHRDILAIIGGSPSGGANRTNPINGWDDPEFGNAMESQFLTPSTEPPRTIIDPKSSPPIGAIVGGAVGGAVVLCIFAILICMFIKKNRKSKTTPAVEETIPQQNHGPVRAQTEIEDSNLSLNQASSYIAHGASGQYHQPPSSRGYSPGIVSPRSPPAGWYSPHIVSPGSPPPPAGCYYPGYPPQQLGTEKEGGPEQRQVGWNSNAVELPAVSREQ